MALVLTRPSRTGSIESVVLIRPTARDKDNRSFARRWYPSNEQISLSIRDISNYSELDYSEYAQEAVTNPAQRSLDKGKGRAGPEPDPQNGSVSDAATSSIAFPNLKSNDLDGLEFQQGDTFVEGSSSGNTIREQYLQRPSSGASAESITQQILAGRDSNKNPAQIAKEVGVPEFVVQATLDAYPRTASSGEPPIAAHQQASHPANSAPASPTSGAYKARRPRLKTGVQAPWNTPGPASSSRNTGKDLTEITKEILTRAQNGESPQSIAKHLGLPDHNLVKATIDANRSAQGGKSQYVDGQLEKQPYQRQRPER